MLLLVSLISSQYVLAFALSEVVFLANILIIGIRYEPDGALNGLLCLVCVSI